MVVAINKSKNREESLLVIELEFLITALKIKEKMIGYKISFNHQHNKTKKMFTFALYRNQTIRPVCSTTANVHSLPLATMRKYA